MRIGIDARFYGSVGKGLGRYTEKLITHLEKIDQQNQYFIFLTRENFGEYQPKNKNFQKVLANYRWYTLAEQIYFPRMLRSYRLDLVHFPHFNVPLLYCGKFVVTIHDLILLHFPTRRGSTLGTVHYWFKFRMYRIVIWSAIRRSIAVIAVSRFTRDDVLQHYPIAKNKIVVTYEACDFPDGVPSEEADVKILATYGILRPYILYVGNAYPHKNLELLIAAFTEILKAHPTLHLVLVGKIDYFYERVKRFVAEQGVANVVFTEFIPDTELNAVYRNAEMYVFPSQYEGFGLPPLEAMANGVPVLAANHPCMREILGDSAQFFESQNLQALVSATQQLLSDGVLRKTLVERGNQQVRCYSWKKMAEETLGVYLHA